MRRKLTKECVITPLPDLWSIWQFLAGARRVGPQGKMGSYELHTIKENGVRPKPNGKCWRLGLACFPLSILLSFCVLLVILG